MSSKTSSSITLEACVTSVRSALAAEAGGADRVELCDNLHDGGTTPGPGSIIAAFKHLNIDLNVIVRPRGGDFLYTDLEFEIMKTEVEYCRNLGINGVVIGLLLPNGQVDKKRTAELVILAGDMSVTFHRAFDMARDPYEALEDLIELGIDRILTSGQRPSVPEGLDLISGLVKQAGDRIIIMPGCGIRPLNVTEVVRQSGASEFHLHLETPAASLMDFKNPRVFMGTDPDLSEYETVTTHDEDFRTFVNAARSAAAS